MILAWEEKTTTDDHGTAAKPAVFETVLVAYDSRGYEWMVAEHDDRLSWNWFYCDDEGNVITGETDHPTRDSAKKGAETHAARFPG